jgi:hypothetical protein
MRLVCRLAVFATLVLVASVRPVQAITVQELIDYHGRLSDDILVALIESDGSVFHLTAADVVALLDRGLSEKVVTAMLRTATLARAAAPTATGPRDAIVTPAPIETPDAEPVQEFQETQETARSTTAPVVVNVTQKVEQKVEPEVRTVAVPVAVPVYVAVPSRPAVTRAAPAPVYWGFGGQRRPDTWQERPTSKPPDKPKGGGGGGFNF